MNNNRRQELYNVQKGLGELKDKLESIMNDEQEGFDNLSEGLQMTIRGAAMEEAVDNMSSAIEAIDEAIDYIDDAAV